jgi:transcriptional regulator
VKSRDARQQDGIPSLAANVRIPREKKMYLPEHFTVSDRTLAVDVMRTHPFALLVSLDGGGLPFATHVPVVAQDTAAGLLLEGHLARANAHATWLEAQRQVLVIFNGPDAYVSPALYESRLAVPTWNYIAVHAYGDVEIVAGTHEKTALLERLVGQHDPAYTAQWQQLPDAYRQKMLDAIVGFRIHVTDLQAKFKLSQNRPAEDRASVWQAFAHASDDPSRELAVWMRRLGLA